MAQTKITWKFPLSSYVFLRIETVFVVLLTVGVFLLSFQKGWFYAVISPIIFLGIYVLVSFLVQKVRKTEERYNVTGTHFQVTRKTRNSVRKEKVPLNEIKQHKLSKTLLGGYLLTDQKKKHLVFFNTKDELGRFDEHLQKHYQSRNKKAPGKRKVKAGQKRTANRKKR
ncbi:MAG TPA: hypothetical protein VJG49_04090 [Candidatus Nanoarchaeia archaeon]|nr:hypothetical protein [Candidatus Nanoarchaeia archaeon]